MSLSAVSLCASLASCITIMLLSLSTRFCTLCNRDLYIVGIIFSLKNFPLISRYLAPGISLTLLLLQSSYDDLVFSVFSSTFFKLRYKIGLLKMDL